MSKLIVLSNRVTLPEPGTTQAGGLAVALEDALNGIGGIWMGWNGHRSKQKQHKFDVLQHGAIAYHTCRLSEQEYQGYYCNYANGALWPLMHDQPQYIQYEPEDYRIYQEVNQKFAQQLKQIAQPNDTIWIHDYHFLSVAHYCRKLGMKNRIGFFLHIPFPAIQQWRSLAECQEIAAHIAQYDLFGLQTQQDQKHCYEFLRQSLNLSSLSPYSLSTTHGHIEVKAYPISVHPGAIQRRASQIEHQQQQPFQLEPGKKHIISVDRIDYSKGLLQKVSAIEHLLNHSPEWQEKFKVFQIACPCRLEVQTYAQLYKDFQQAVTDLNQHYTTPDHPVFECSYDSVAHHQLMQLYRQAGICWVNSVKDGMNLVAKEYIAAQDPEDPGVLILSKYAGAAEQMKQALLVDPHDVKSMTRAIQQAVKMSKSERLARYSALFKSLQDYDIVRWRNDFLHDLKRRSPASMYRLLSGQQHPLHLHS